MSITDDLAVVREAVGNQPAVAALKITDPDDWRVQLQSDALAALDRIEREYENGASVEVPCPTCGRTKHYWSRRLAEAERKLAADVKCPYCMAQFGPVSAVLASREQEDQP